VKRVFEHVRTVFAGFNRKHNGIESSEKYHCNRASEPTWDSKLTPAETVHGKGISRNVPEISK